ncbi:hypothetical protein MOVS_07260 [Moraxella ovis]|uniref:Uncharacterized protein n=1 Tax=Moraxella ovis TaxID=29433 RepID=A0ABM6BDI3_9GAMM|nr:hypothetical protein MOVS_07260 [Moraxella ovis]
MHTDLILLMPCAGKVSFEWVIKYAFVGCPIGLIALLGGAWRILGGGVWVTAKGNIEKKGYPCRVAL